MVPALGSTLEGGKERLVLAEDQILPALTSPFVLTNIGYDETSHCPYRVRTLPLKGLHGPAG